MHGDRTYRALIEQIERLRASERLYRQLVESTSEGVIYVDTLGDVTFANGRAAGMLETTVPEMLARPLADFLADPDAPRHRLRRDERRRGKGEVFEDRFRTAQGNVVWFRVHADPVYDGDGHVVGSIKLLTNITQNRRDEEVRNRLASIVASSEDGIFAIERDGTIATWNRGAARIFGYQSDEIIGRSLSTLIPFERACEMDLSFPRVLKGEHVEPFETRHLRRDRTLVDVLVTWSAIRDARDRVTGVSAIVRDLTERRKAEQALRRSEDQLRQAQKMEAIGSLAGGVAHDFNNLLSIILSYAGLAIDSLEGTDPLREDLIEVRRAAERAAALTRHLLAFSRRQIMQPKVLDVGKLVSGMANMLRRMIGEDIELDIDVAPNLGGTLADPTQIEQVVMNLVANARDAMPRGGHLVVAVADATIDASPGESSELAPERFICISVCDQGSGMSPATRARIFEPFFTTKEQGRGTGLGLATVFGIVKQSGGHITVESTLGLGSTFRVFLPRHSDAVASSEDQSPAPLRRGSETILLVEDEDPLRRLARAVLQRNGYTVLEAQNAGEAFLICEQFGGEIHLMLTDVVMPRMSGRELAERVAPVRPRMKVLFMSGHTEDAVLRHGVSNASMAFLPKPFTPSTLLSKVREVLERPASDSRRAQSLIGKPPM